MPTFGKGVVYDVDLKVRTEQFRFFTEALKKDRLKKYVPMFAAEAEVRGEQGWNETPRLLQCCFVVHTTSSHSSHAL